MGLLECKGTPMNDVHKASVATKMSWISRRGMMQIGKPGMLPCRPLRRQRIHCYTVKAVKSLSPVSSAKVSETRTMSPFSPGP